MFVLCYLLFEHFPQVKDLLKERTAEALAAGVFGVPSIVCDGELFWGNDRLHWVEARLRGEDPLPEGAAEALLAIPTGVVRKTR